jgi:hypothetical protein
MLRVPAGGHATLCGLLTSKLGVGVFFASVPRMKSDKYRIKILDTGSTVPSNINKINLRTAIGKLLGKIFHIFISVDDSG